VQRSRFRKSLVKKDAGGNSGDQKAEVVRILPPLRQPDRFYLSANDQELLKFYTTIRESAWSSTEFPSIRESAWISTKSAGRSCPLYAVPTNPISNLVRPRSLFRTSTASIFVVGESIDVSCHHPRWKSKGEFRTNWSRVTSYTRRLINSRPKRRLRRNCPAHHHSRNRSM
jgi:hypothetical protein